MSLIEQLLEHRAKRARLLRPYRIAKRPPQPTRAEKAYVADLHRLVFSWGDVTREHIVPNLATIAKARTDHAPTTFNEFAILSDTINRLTSSDVIVPIFQKQADRVADFTSSALGQSMGIDVAALFSKSILGPTVDDFIQSNTDLIKSLAGDYVDRTASTLSAMQGARASDISNALQYALDVTESHADLIAIDQTLKLNSNLTELRQTQVGVTEYVWMTAHDERVRPDHQALDGTRHAWADEPPIVDEKSGRREHPGRDFRCRCQAIAVVPGFS
jgi:SPP1 gp7 family putative phage head morphogenesis protein